MAGTDRFEQVVSQWHQMIHNMAVERARFVSVEHDDLMQEAHLALWKAMKSEPWREWHGGEVKHIVAYRMGELRKGGLMTGEPKGKPGQPRDPMRRDDRHSTDDMHEPDDDGSVERLRGWAMRGWMKLSSPSAEELALRDMDYRRPHEERVREALEEVAVNGHGRYDETIADFAVMQSSHAFSHDEMSEALGKPYGTLRRAWERRTRPKLRQMLAPVVEGSAA